MTATTEGLRLAATTFTVAPIKGPKTITKRSAAVAMLSAPAIGLALGVVAALAVYVMRVLVGINDYPPVTLLPAAIGITFLALMTRGLHLDGLADTTDGLASYGPADRARSIMQSGTVGPLGMVTVVLALLLQVTALSQAIRDHHGTAAMVVSCVAARAVIPLTCRRGVRAAQAEGLGARVAESVPRTAALAALVVSLVVVALIAQSDTHTLDRHFETLQSIAAVLIAVIGCELLRLHCSRRLGGVSGDVLGALVEVGMTISLLVMAVSPAHRFGGS